MSEFISVWLLLALCVGVPAVAWVTFRGHTARKASGRDVGEQEYVAVRRREIASLLAEKLPQKTPITCCRTKFEAVYDPARDAVWVSNLGASPYLPSDVFLVAAEVLATHGRAPRGDAMSGKLGEPCLPLDSIEGAVAHRVFGREEGEAVFRRITPILALLVHLRLAEYDCRQDQVEAPGLRVTVP